MFDPVFLDPFDVAILVDTFQEVRRIKPVH
jgi:hypothetical protein